MEHELILPVEAAEYLGISPRTLERWRHQSMGPAYVRIGRRVMYIRGLLLDYVWSQVRTH